MTSLVERIQRRRFYPVPVAGETFHVRALSIADRRRMDAIEDILDKSFFALGRGLCNGDGSEAFPRRPEEGDLDYARRMANELAEIPTDTFSELCAAINKIGIAPREEVIAKN